ncbi:MAG TPA: Holliday junction resolvase RuvX [Candidatus Udaeobacter sp.]|nr:Holliday junction resolvase RuvX [Candidatus Udaeobacter sp.]
MTELEVQRLVTPPELAGQRIDRALAILAAGLTRTEAQRVIASGGVLLNGEPVTRSSERLAAGDELVVRLPERPPLALVPEPIPLDVRYEDAHVAVLMKPAGLVVHPGAGVRTGTLVAGLLARYPTLPGDPLRPGLVHRLDRNTSGLLVVALSREALAGLAAQVAARSMRRRYEAIVWGEPNPPAGVIAASIARSLRDRTRMAIAHRGGRSAETGYETVEVFRVATRLAVDLRTGRTHQIRVHLEHLGYPVVGDPVYSGRPHNLVRFPVAERSRVQRLLQTLRRQALHAFELGFVHPVTGEPLRFEAERPADLARALAILRGEEPEAGEARSAAPAVPERASPAARTGRRFLGIDCGARRVGIAISDPTGRIATPLAQLEPANEPDLVDQVAELAENEGIQGVVVGDPRHASGEPSPGSAIAARLAGLLGRRMGCPVWLWDERLTTFAAEDALRAVEAARGSRRRKPGTAGARSARRERQARVNQLAAAVILQDFLDTHANQSLPRPVAGPGARPEGEAPSAEKPGE